MRTPAQMDQVALLTDFQVTYSMIESTHSSGNRSSAIGSYYYWDLRQDLRCVKTKVYWLTPGVEAKPSTSPMWVFPIHVYC